MSKSLIEKCPFRPDSASAKIYLTLARSSTAITADEVCSRTKLPEQQVRNLIQSYAHNIMHDAPLRRAGVRILAKNGKYSVVSCAAQPNAKRPPRGDGKIGKKAKAASKPKSKHKAKKKKPAMPKQESVPVAAQAPTGNSDTAIK